MEVKVTGCVIVSIGIEPLALGELGTLEWAALFNSISAVEIRSDKALSRNCMGNGEESDCDGGNFRF